MTAPTPFPHGRAQAGPPRQDESRLLHALDLRAQLEIEGRGDYAALTSETLEATGIPPHAGGAPCAASLLVEWDTTSATVIPFPSRG